MLHFVQKRENIRNYTGICSFMWKKYKKNKLDAKEIGYIQDICRKWVEGKEE